jgi:hypothetical protein
MLIDFALQKTASEIYLMSKIPNLFSASLWAAALTHNREIGMPQTRRLPIKNFPVFSLESMWKMRRRPKHMQAQDISLSEKGAPYTGHLENDGGKNKTNLKNHSHV